MFLKHNQSCYIMEQKMSTDLNNSTENFKAALEKSSGSRLESKPKSKFSDRKKKKPKQLSSIENNPFAIIVATTPDHDSQMEKMVSLMTYVDAETTKINNQALVEYSAHMQEQRQILAVELIEMTDTKTFSNMQKVILDINNGVLDFEEQIKPFMEIINAVRLIQEENATTDILEEMREDEKQNSDIQGKLGGIDFKKSEISKTIQDKLRDINLEKNKKSLWGLGGVKKDALKKIATYDAEISTLKEEIKTLEAQKSDIKSNAKEITSKYAHLAEAKKTLADMLNLSEGAHEERHVKLINTAVSFVETTKERVSGTLEHSMAMDTQLKNLSNLAFTMRGNYTVLSEASKKAEIINSELHEAIKEELLNSEDTLSNLNKEKISRDLAKHITSLNDSSRSTTSIISDLTLSSQRIETMEAANIAQIKNTEQIQTSGIAGVADNLSSVLTTINQAAIGQASNAAKQSLRRMNTNTIELTKEGMLNAVKSQNEDNANLIRSLEQFTELGEVIELANTTTFQALEENRALVDEFRSAADELQRASKDSIELTSTAITEEISNRD